MRKKDQHFFNEFTILGVFVAVALIGLIAAGVSLLAQPRFAPVGVPTVQAPTSEEYRVEARSVVMPFLSQAAVISANPMPEGASETMSDLVDLTQERLLGMTVPASERDVHLSMVILLDQWRRALNGTDADLSGVIDRTDGLLKDYPWLGNL